MDVEFPQLICGESCWRHWADDPHMPQQTATASGHGSSLLSVRRPIATLTVPTRNLKFGNGFRAWSGQLGWLPRLGVAQYGMQDQDQSSRGTTELRQHLVPHGSQRTSRRARKGRGCFDRRPDRGLHSRCDHPGLRGWAGDPQPGLGRPAVVARSPGGLPVTTAPGEPARAGLTDKVDQ